MSITSTQYGRLSSGEEVRLFTLTNQNGLRAEITNYGAIVVALFVPDRKGNLDDVVLGKDSLDAYLAGHPYFGSTCGRVAGRIGGAQFTLNGQNYSLAANNPPNHLHGGPEGFESMLWQADIIQENGLDKLKLSLTDPDGHNGFPGTVECTVTYALREDDSLEINYQATSDHDTPLNLTNHSYFNLKGSGQGNILGHRLQIFADSVATVDGQATLLGRRDPVVEGYNDYRAPTILSSRDTLEIGNADIHFFLNEGRTLHPKLAARVEEPESGRRLEVFTTEPGVQFYAGISLSADGLDLGKGGVTHQALDAFCLETQDYADSINFPEMGSAILREGDTFTSTTFYRFSTQD